MSEPLLARLVSDGVLSREDADRLAARHAATGTPLDALLLEERHVPASRLPELLARASGLPAAPESAFTAPDPRARRVFPAKVAERHRIAPFALDGRDLSVVTGYPPDTGLIEELGVMLSLRLRAHVAPEARVRALVQQLYGAAPPPRPTLATRDASPAPASASRAPAVPATEPGDGTPAEHAPSDPRPPGWSTEEARAALSAASGPEEAIRVALRATRDVFAFGAAFSVRKDVIAGQDALGSDPRAREACRRILVDLDSPGLFGAPLATRAPYLGPPPGDPVTGSVLAGLGRVQPHTVLVAPVWVGERPACVIYADNDDAPVGSRRLSELFLLLGALGETLARMILERKAREPHGAAPAPGRTPAPDDGPTARSTTPIAAAPEEAWSVNEPARVDPDPLPFAVDVDVGEYEVLPASEALATPRADDAVALVEALAVSAAGSDERRALVERLAAAGPEAAAALVDRLPGPEEAAAPADGAAPVETWGPIFAGVAAAGRLAERPLLGLLDDPDPARRRAAVALLARTGSGEVLPAIAARVQDDDDRVAAEAARALLAARSAPAYAPVVADLRRALASGRPARAARAARALGRLRDPDSVPVLIQLLDGGGEPGTAAEEALSAITLQRLGGDSMRWIAWWREWRAAPRASWLFMALEGPDAGLRSRAADELRRAGAPPVVYDPGAPEAERVAAARAWAGWWREEGLAL
ncbi:MAG TPA: HEAT repeat domain-containing protein [Anaeromyxobacteraceae bacterium]|nr:HEAT repeat domain-containing protein [Anaeromyxobacteraceae bacterium]